MEKNVCKNRRNGVLLLSIFIAAIVCVAAFVFCNITIAHSEGEEVTPVAVYVLGDSTLTDAEKAVGFRTTEATSTEPVTYTYESYAAGWSAAIRQSIANNGGNLVKVVLASTWNSAAKDFGSGTGFTYGMLYVPAKANVLLDLKGCNIDKGLVTANKVSEFGRVFKIQGELTIDDSSSTKAGKITGGYTTSVGGVYKSSIPVNSHSKAAPFPETNLHLTAAVYIAREPLCLPAATSITTPLQAKPAVYTIQALFR